jgi:hypothetical protein
MCYDPRGYHEFSSCTSSVGNRIGGQVTCSSGKDCRIVTLRYQLGVKLVAWCATVSSILRRKGRRRGHRWLPLHHGSTIRPTPWNDAQIVLTVVICTAAAINRRRQPSPSRRSAFPKSRQRSVTAKMHATSCWRAEGRSCIRMVRLADGMIATLVTRLDGVK